MPQAGIALTSVAGICCVHCDVAAGGAGGELLCEQGQRHLGPLVRLQRLVVDLAEVQVRHAQRCRRWVQHIRPGAD